MGVPTKEELKQAIETAIDMREKGNDENFLAKSILSLNYRYNEAEKLIQQAKIYLHSGTGAIEHAKLMKAIEEFERISHPTRELNQFGLK